MPATSHNVEAHWISPSAKPESLSLNQAGCVRLPETEGVIEVSTRLPRASLRHVFSARDSLEFKRLSMIASPQLSITSRCNDAVTFARDRLFFPFTASTNGDFSNVAISLLAAGQHVLWEKPWGEVDVHFPESVNLGSLKEGTYDLQLGWQELSQGDDKDLSSICKVTILRQGPVLDGFPLVANPVPQTIAQNSILPWVSKNPEDALWLCRHSFSEEEEYCKKPEHYKPVQLIVTDKAGLWEYCLIAEDKAGNRSPPHCQKFLVSAAAPELRVAWADKDLQGRLPLLKRPYAHLDAAIEVSHPLLSNEELQSHLQCKVNLVIGSHIQAAGSHVFCAKGSCAGQDLSEFRSCPTQLTLDLRSLWSQSLERRSRLHLTVRAADGAGQISEATTSVWIHDQAWYAEPLSLGTMGVSADEIPVSVRHDAKGRPWLLTQLNGQQPLVYVQDGARWRRTLDLSESDFSEFNELDLIQDASHNIYLAGASSFDNRLLLYRLNADETWTPMAAPHKDFAEECIRFVGLRPAGIVCLTGAHLYSWQNALWSVLDRPAACTQLDRAVVIDDDKVWTTCQGQMYRHRAGAWEKKPTAGIDVVEDFRLDAKGRLWAQTLFPFYENNGLGYFTDDGQWHLTGPSQGLPDSIMGRVLTFGKNQRIYFGPFAWNEDTLHWDMIEADDQTLFDLSAESLQALQNRTWMAINNQSSLVEMDEARPMVWHFASEGMSYNATDIAFRDEQDQFWWFLWNKSLDRKDIHHLRDSHFLLWDERFAGMNIQGDSFVNEMKMDAKGQLWLLRSGRLYRYEEGHWRFQANFSAPVPAHLLPSASGRLFLGAPGALYEWTSAGAKLMHTWPGTPLYVSQLAEDGEGSLWFRMSTAVEGTVHRLQGKEWTSFTVPPIDDETFLNARLFIDRGRLLMLVGSVILGFDKKEGRFVPVDPESLGLPTGLVYEAYALNTEETLVEALEAGEGPRAFRLISRHNKAPEILPLLPGNHFMQGFIKDIDARIWGLDNQGQLSRLKTDQTWEPWLHEAEILSRLKIDGLGASQMVPTAEGGIFLQQAETPLLRILP